MIYGAGRGEPGAESQAGRGIDSFHKKWKPNASQSPKLSSDFLLLTVKHPPFLTLQQVRVITFIKGIFSLLKCHAVLLGYLVDMHPLTHHTIDELQYGISR